ncbi:hypothetical protein [Streptomyces sp. NE06-03C]|uniref:hypothetical protein n=1 Tax=Streptomyces sp. NE06-03C TaxID=3028694 RepID=UPI0029AFA39B|nr:hypothetical protein [Streptomyces sp. NE06-03C]MDX2922894.1 hypothetical protein [Streptomyces sp. NE06-03C]
MPSLAPERLTEIRALLTELATARTLPAAAPEPDLLRRCATALTDVLRDRDDLAANFKEIAEELATWTGALR